MSQHIDFKPDFDNVKKIKPKLIDEVETSLYKESIMLYVAIVLLVFFLILSSFILYSI